MLNVNIICLGKLKESYLRDACKEYEKRLGAFCKLNVVELEPINLPQNPSENQIKSALEQEAKRILQKIPSNSYTFAMCIEGKQFSSENFAERLQNIANSGKSTVNFILGSSFGMADEVKNAADFRFSMSQMTFPHQLARVMVLEQVYRGFSILGNSKYHK